MTNNDVVDAEQPRLSHRGVDVDDGGEGSVPASSLKPPERDESFGASEAEHARTIVKEGLLGINRLQQKYIVLFGDGRVFAFHTQAKAQAEGDLSQAGTSQRLYQIVPGRAKNTVTFIFQNGDQRDFRTKSADEQAAWVTAGHSLKIHV